MNKKCSIVGDSEGYLLCILESGHKGKHQFKDISMISDKPKTSTLDGMSNEDLALVNKLVIACSTLYDKTASSPSSGPHSNPSEMEHLKSQILLLALRVGERVWYPRGNPDNTTSENVSVDIECL